MVTLYLNSTKVVRNFGVRPHLGRRLRLRNMPLIKGNLPYKKAFGRETFDDKYTVEVMVALRPIRGKRHHYEVLTLARCEDMVVEWLVDNCGW